MTLCGWVRNGIEEGSRRGSILLTVLAVIFILVTMFLSILTYALVRHGYHLRQQNRLIAGHLARSGLQRCLDDFRKLPWSEVDQVVAAPNGGSIEIAVRPWGPYLLVLSDGRYANQSVRGSAVVGSSAPALFAAAISVCNTDYPLAVTGNTRIIGDVNTGPSGMIEGRMSGVTVAEEDYHQGLVRESETLTMPVPDTSVLGWYRRDISDRRNQVARFYAGPQVFTAKDTGRLVPGEGISIGNGLRIEDLSVVSPGSITSVFVGGNIEIVGKTRLSGLVELVADGPISLADSAVVDGALLCSGDSILISGSSVFSGVAVSDRIIVVDGEAEVLYPSALFLDARRVRCGEDCGIVLKSRGVLESSCVLASARGSGRCDDCLLRLDTMVWFTGFLLSDTRADVRGTVFGSVVAEEFCFSTPSSAYVNWVRDVHISRPALDFTPVLPVLTESAGGACFRTLRYHTSP